MAPIDGPVGTEGLNDAANLRRRRWARVPLAAAIAVVAAAPTLTFVGSRGAHASTPMVSTYPPPSTPAGVQLGLSGIAAGRDGDLWTAYVDFSTGDGGLVRIDPRTGASTTIPIPPAFGYPTDVIDITPGPPSDPDSMWFTQYDGNIGRISTTNPSTITNYPLPAPTAFPGQICGTSMTSETLDPAGITVGPDGNLWIAIQCLDQVARMTPTGQVTLFPAGDNADAPPGEFYDPDVIVSGPDGNLWFTRADFLDQKGKGNAIVRMTTSGTITGDFTMADDAFVPFGITVGPDRALWFTEANFNDIGTSTPSGKIGRISAAGKVIEYPIAPVSAVPVGIVTGGDGNLWFADENDALGRATTRGAITEFPAPGGCRSGGGFCADPFFPANGPSTTDPSGMWFTEFGPNETVRVDLHQADALTAKPRTSSSHVSVAFSGPVADFGDADGNTDATAYSATIDWGDGTAASPGVIGGGSVFHVYGTHTYAAAATYRVTVSMVDQDGAAATVMSAAHVAP